jgi:F-type H+-transporting ATPase subunit epsilon
MDSAKHLRLEFVTPERSIVHEDVDEVELPLDDGYAGVLPGHAPLLALIRTGEMWYRKGSVITRAFVSGGLAEILGDRVSVLARVAERAEQIDVARAEAAKRRAESLLEKPSADIDVERARLALFRALTRLQISSQRTTKTH